MFKKPDSGYFARCSGHYLMLKNIAIRILDADSLAVLHKDRLDLSSYLGQGIEHDQD